MKKLVRTITSGIDKEFRRIGDPKRATGEKKYLKSDLTFRGVSKPKLRRVLSSVLATHGPLDRRHLRAVVEALWVQPVFEQRSAAVDLLDRHLRLLKRADLRLVEKLIRQSQTWALVDWLAVPIAGYLVDRYPALGRTLDRWSTDQNFWVRRSAMLALLMPLRRGDGDFERFGRYADAMLEEREFFIRKAIGWVLRETSKKQPQLVNDWLAPRARRASGVTVREAVKYLAPAQRMKILKAYRTD